MASTSFTSPVFTGANYGLVPLPPQPATGGRVLLDNGTWGINAGSPPIFDGSNPGMVPAPAPAPPPQTVLAGDGSWQPYALFTAIRPTPGLVAGPATPPAQPGRTVLADDGTWMSTFTSSRPGLVPIASATGGQAVLADNASWVWFGTFTTSTKGLVPPPPSNTGNTVLYDNGTWGNPTPPLFTAVQAGLVSPVGFGFNTSAYYIGGDNASHPMPTVFTHTQAGLVPPPAGTTGATVLADNGTWINLAANTQVPPFSGSATGTVNATGANNTSSFYIGGDNAAHAASFTLGSTLVPLGTTLSAINGASIGQTTPAAGTFTSVSTGNIGCNIVTANQSITAGLNGGQTGTITIRGATSGGAIITAQPAAGLGTFQLPNITGTATFAVGATAPLSLNATTGQLTSQPGIYINQQIFRTVGTATYTPTAGTNFVVVKVIGGGGGGGGTAVTAASQVSAAGGGGGGGYAERRITSGFAGVTVTVGAAGTAGAVNAAGGAGGTSSFGALASATGGGGGFVGPVTATTPAFTSNGGLPGAGSGGDINSGGQRGTTGYCLQLNGGRGGDGGALMPYSGGSVYVSSGGSNGFAATGNGGGGSGANSAPSQSGFTGGAGSPGLVIVDEFA